MKYYEDPILGKGRAADVTGGTGGGTEYIGGFAIGIYGETISRLRYMPIESVTGNSVTLQAGHAYKAYATSTAITLNTETIPANQFGLEGHIEIYVAGTGYVVTGSNVVLANALEPDAVNNCTVRFHDGIAIISVEDHVAGYIVVNGATSGDGSLYYGISTSTNDYVAFDASLNGTVIPLAGAVAEGEKHIVGNGYTETMLTGAVDCGTSAVISGGSTTYVPYKFTVANLALSNVQVTGGVMTLGDAYIPSGSTVAVSGGGLAVEKVTGNGGVIDLGGTFISAQSEPNISGAIISNGLRGGEYGGALYVGSFRSATMNGATFVGNSAAGGGAIGVRYNDATANIVSCLITGNTAYTGGGIGLQYNNATAIITGSTITGNRCAQFDDGGGGIVVKGQGTETCELTDCIVSGNTNGLGAPDDIANKNILKIKGGCTIGHIKTLAGTASFSGSNTVDLISGGTGSVVFSSGAILDLTGNTNTTPIIAPGGGITFAPGGATILTGGTAGVVDAQYTLGGMTIPQIGNTNVVNLSSSNVVISSGGTAYASGCVFSGGSTLNRGIQVSVVSGGRFVASGCSFTSARVGTARNGAVSIRDGGSVLDLTDCIFSANKTAADGYAAFATSQGNPSANFTRCTFVDNESNNVIGISGTAVVTFTDCNFGEGQNTYTIASVAYVGSNKILAAVTGNTTGSVTFSSGAIVDLTGNTNATPIAPGGGVIVDGGCQVITSGGTTVPLAAGTYTQINNDGTTE